VVIGEKTNGWAPYRFPQSHDMGTIFLRPSYGEHNTYLSSTYITIEPNQSKEIKIKEGETRPTHKRKSIGGHKMTYPSNDLSPRFLDSLGLASNCVETQSLRPSPSKAKQHWGKRSCVSLSKTNQFGLMP